jgi:hypothetical protein
MIQVSYFLTVSKTSSSYTAVTIGQGPFTATKYSGSSSAAQLQHVSCISQYFITYNNSAYGGAPKYTLLSQNLIQSNGGNLSGTLGLTGSASLNNVSYIPLTIAPGLSSTGVQNRVLLQVGFPISNPPNNTNNVNVLSSFGCTIQILGCDTDTAIIQNPYSSILPQRLNQFSNVGRCYISTS